MRNFQSRIHVRGTIGSGAKMTLFQTRCADRAAASYAVAPRAYTVCRRRCRDCVPKWLRALCWRRSLPKLSMPALELKPGGRIHAHN
mmetsp:Transcript_59594/g.191774  ORF Transcript_59594/g.191774 Transcript_59594/m.191774 type:complete len:87 (-) Transcript_59594:1015-1275(-)